jgi:2-desacetyl-2-hydroxyethyl bacteriochlorophyllide A dehydrogenase
MPETSIIIRTYNEERHLGNLLRAIGMQDYKDYEIIIVDSGSTDKTLEIAQKFPVNIIKIESRDFTFGYALNIGCKASRGKYLIFASAHILPATNSWLSQFVTSFKDPAVAMAYGRQKGNADSKYSEQKDFWRFFSKTAVNSKVPLHYANNANAAIRKSIWEEEKFDEYLFGLEDIDWTRRVTSKGLLIRYEPNAPVYHIHRETWPQVFNRYRREAIAAVQIGLPYPPQVHLGVWWLLLRILADIFGSSDWSFARLEEILRFRYYQWKGSNLGWKQGKNLDFDRKKNSFFCPDENQAVVIKGKSKAEIESLSIPEIRPGDILIKVDYVGVCRTDIEVYEGTLGYYRDGVASYPIVPGHEFSGTIVKIGANNKYRERFKVGEAVVGLCILSRGEDGVRKEVGVINHNGGYGQFVLMPGSFVQHVPLGLDQKTAALTEPLAVVLRAMRRIKSRLFKEAHIIVIGAGPIGHLCSKVLVHEGYEVSVFDKNIDRLNLLKNKVFKTYSLMDNLERFDVIIEATGSEVLLKKVLKHSKFDSTILLLGFPYGNIDYNFENLVGEEKVIIGSVGSEKEDFAQALKLLPQLDMAPFTQVVMPLENFEKAWQLHKTSKHLKILLKP